MEEREKRVSELSKAMPKVPIIAVKEKPKVLYKKDGSLSALGTTWFQQLDERGLSPDTESFEFIKGYEEPNPGSNKQLKDWLFSLGWEPDTYKQNEKKEEVPQINKEKQKGGGVSDSVKKLYDVCPNLESLDGLSILNHRIPILSGFISNSSGGYLVARIAGLTNTLRFIHTEIVNLPKVNLPFAAPVRGSLICEEDEVLIGTDMSGLEDRLKQHFLWPLPHQLANLISAAQSAQGLAIPCSPAHRICGISVTFATLSPTERYVPIHYSPVRHSPPDRSPCCRSTCMCKACRQRSI